MSEFDPLSLVTDQPLLVNEAVLAQLREFRVQQRLPALPGLNVESERERLGGIVNALIDTLIASLAAHPSKLWVMRQFQLALQQVQMEDTEGREHFGVDLEQLMDILNIESSDGLLMFYLVGF